MSGQRVDEFEREQPDWSGGGGAALRARKRVATPPRDSPRNERPAKRASLELAQAPLPAASPSIAHGGSAAQGLLQGAPADDEDLLALNLGDLFPASMLPLCSPSPSRAIRPRQSARESELPPSATSVGATTPLSKRLSASFAAATSSSRQGDRFRADAPIRDARRRLSWSRTGLTDSERRPAPEKAAQVVSSPQDARERAGADAIVGRKEDVLTDASGEDSESEAILKKKETVEECDEPDGAHMATAVILSDDDRESSEAASAMRLVDAAAVVSRGSRPNAWLSSLCASPTREPQSGAEDKGPDSAERPNRSRGSKRKRFGSGLCQRFEALLRHRESRANIQAYKMAQQLRCSAGGAGGEAPRWNAPAGMLGLKILRSASHYRLTFALCAVVGDECHESRLSALLHRIVDDRGRWYCFAVLPSAELQRLGAGASPIIFVAWPWSQQPMQLTMHLTASVILSSALVVPVAERFAQDAEAFLLSCENRRCAVAVPPASRQVLSKDSSADGEGVPEGLDPVLVADLLQVCACAHSRTLEPLLEPQRSDGTHEIDRELGLALRSDSKGAHEQQKTSDDRDVMRFAIAQTHAFQRNFCIRAVVCKALLRGTFQADAEQACGFRTVAVATGISRSPPSLAFLHDCEGAIALLAVPAELLDAWAPALLSQRDQVLSARDLRLQSRWSLSEDSPQRHLRSVLQALGFRGVSVPVFAVTQQSSYVLERCTWPEQRLLEAQTPPMHVEDLAQFLQLRSPGPVRVDLLCKLQQWVSGPASNEGAPRIRVASHDSDAAGNGQPADPARLSFVVTIAAYWHSRVLVSCFAEGHLALLRDLLVLASGDSSDSRLVADAFSDVCMPVPCADEACVKRAVPPLYIAANAVGAARFLVSAAAPPSLSAPL